MLQSGRNGAVRGIHSVGIGTDCGSGSGFFTCAGLFEGGVAAGAVTLRWEGEGEGVADGDGRGCLNRLLLFRVGLTGVCRPVGG